MKKNLTKLTIISIVCGIVSIMLCYFTIKYISSPSFEESYEEVVNEIGDDSGVGKLIGIPIAGVAKLGIVILGVFILLIPSAIIFIIILLQIIARLMQIGNEKKWKNTTSKILTYISMVIQIFLSIILLFYIFSNLKVNKVLLIIAFIINVICIITFIIELKKIRSLTATEAKE